MINITFTDDDLKWFNEWIIDCYESNKFYCRTHEIEALLARLEAAEKVIRSVPDIAWFKRVFPLDQTDAVLCEQFLEDLKAWRKACGL